MWNTNLCGGVFNPRDPTLSAVLAFFNYQPYLQKGTDSLGWPFKSPWEIPLFGRNVWWLIWLWGLTHIVHTTPQSHALGLPGGMIRGLLRSIACRARLCMTQDIQGYSVLTKLNTQKDYGEAQKIGTKKDPRMWPLLNKRKYVLSPYYMLAIILGVGGNIDVVKKGGGEKPYLKNIRFSWR